MLNRTLNICLSLEKHIKLYTVYCTQYITLTFYIHSEYKNFKSVTANQQEQQVSNILCLFMFFTLYLHVCILLSLAHILHIKAMF